MFEQLHDVEKFELLKISGLILGITISSAIMLLIGSSSFKGKVSDMLFNIGRISIIIGFISLVSTAFIFFSMEDIDSDEVLESNLKQKYGIERVITDDGRYPIQATIGTEQFIQVETTDNRKAVFILTQNLDTFEPTLEELVDNGTSEAVNLEDITK